MRPLAGSVTLCVVQVQGSEGNKQDVQSMDCQEHGNFAEDNTASCARDQRDDTAMSDVEIVTASYRRKSRGEARSNLSCPDREPKQTQGGEHHA